MWGMPFDASHEQIRDIQETLNKAAREAADRVNTPAWANNFEQKFKNREEWFDPYAGNSWWDKQQGYLKHDPTIVAELSRIWRERQNQTYPGPDGTRQNWYNPDAMGWAKTEQWYLRHDPTIVADLSKRWREQAEKQQKWPEVSSDFAPSLQVFWATYENWNIILDNWKVLKPDNNVAKISVENFAQAKMLNWPASMTVRIDNKDWTVQLIHFKKWPEWNSVSFEKGKKPEQEQIRMRHNPKVNEELSRRQEGQNIQEPNKWNWGPVPQKEWWYKHSPGTADALNKIRQNRETVNDMISKYFSQWFWQDVMWSALKDPNFVNSLKDVLSLTSENRLFDDQDGAWLAEVLITSYKNLPPELKSGFDAKIKNYTIRNMSTTHPWQKFIESWNYKITTWLDDRGKISAIMQFPNWTWLNIRNDNSDNIPRAK